MLNVVFSVRLLQRHYEVSLPYLSPFSSLPSLPSILSSHPSISLHSYHLPSTPLHSAIKMVLQSQQQQKQQHLGRGIPIRSEQTAREPWKSTERLASVHLTEGEQRYLFLLEKRKGRAPPSPGPGIDVYLHSTTQL